MLSGFSQQHDNGPPQEKGRGADIYRALTDYMDAPTVIKEVDGAKVEVARDPVPERLHGRADSLRRSIAALSFQRKYRFGLLSFAQSDIDVVAFNAGEPILRRQVDLALDLFVRTLWPGVPVPARPGLYVTTHTHTGRLEVNVALPRSVFLGERPFSHNPHPPTPFGEAPRLWRAMRDVLNARFGWADPEDPARRRNLARPDLQLKLEAEACRAGLMPEIDRREELLTLLLSEIDAGHVSTRPEIVACLQAHLKPQGWAVLGETRNSVTVGDPAAPVKERLRLRGRVFDQEFSGAVWVNDPEFLARQKLARASELAMAPIAFMQAWHSTASFNVERYGKGTWVQPTWDLADWLAEDPAALPRLIPSRHHAIALSLGGKRKETDYGTAVTHGAPVPEFDGPDRAGSGEADHAAGSPDYGAGSHQPEKQPENRIGPQTAGGAGSVVASAGDRIGQLEQHARQISGPAGMGAVLARIALQLKACSAELGQFLARATVARLIPDGIAARLTTTSTTLEKLNATCEGHRGIDARSEPDFGSSSAPSGTPAFDDADGGGQQQPEAGRLDAEPQRSRMLPGADGDAAAANSKRNGGSGKDRGGTDRQNDGNGQALQRGRGADGPVGKPFDRTDPPAPRPDIRAEVPLANLLNLSRRVSRLLTSDLAGSLRRITGGFRITVPGASVTIRADGLGVEYWHLRQARLDATRTYVNRLLGFEPMHVAATVQGRPFEDGPVSPNADHCQASAGEAAVEEEGRNGLTTEPDEDPADDFGL